MAKSRPIFAIVYGFDGTLTASDFEKNSLFPPSARRSHEFWCKLYAAAEGKGSKFISLYMRHMLGDPKGKMQIRRQALLDHGSKLKLFAGVAEWFDHISEQGSEIGFDVKHFVVSSGLREIINGTPIGQKPVQTYGSEYVYDSTGEALGAHAEVSQKEKLLYLSEISAGNNKYAGVGRITSIIARDAQHIPFERILFIGNAELDAGCFRYVTQRGGAAMAIYRPHAQGAQDRAHAFCRDTHVRCVVPGDYGKGKAIELSVVSLMNLVAAKEKYAALTRLFGVQVQSCFPSVIGTEGDGGDDVVGAPFFACGTASTSAQPIESIFDEGALLPSGAVQRLEALSARVALNMATPSLVNQAQP